MDASIPSAIPSKASSNAAHQIRKIPPRVNTTRSAGISQRRIFPSLV